MLAAHLKIEIPRKGSLSCALNIRYSVFANTSLIKSKNKTSVTVSVTFQPIIPSNYESVTFGQFEEGGRRAPTGPSVTVTFINSK